MINKPHVEKAYFQEKGVHIVIKIRNIIKKGNFIFFFA